MDRFTWFRASEGTEEIVTQAGYVSIFDGDQKATAFDNGTVSLTPSRLIWADYGDADCRLSVHHSLITSIEKHKHMMFSRSGRITVHLSPAPPSYQGLGPMAGSPFHSVRLQFKHGGEEDFYKKYKHVVSKKSWQSQTPSSSTSSGSRQSGSNSAAPVPRQGGIAAIEKRRAEQQSLQFSLAEQTTRTQENISEGFEDLGSLMEMARDMVGISKSISEKLRHKQGEITADETVQFKSYLLSLGVSDPVTKSAYGSGAVYYEKLAHELSKVLEQPLKECGGMMALPDVYCRVNRARGLELLSPEDLLNACGTLSRLNLPIKLHRFDSGVYVVQLDSMGVETTVDETTEYITASPGATAQDLSQFIGISVVLAKERLLAAEEQAKLCRDDTVEGLKFYPNKFTMAEAVDDLANDCQRIDSSTPVVAAVAS